MKKSTLLFAYQLFFSLALFAQAEEIEKVTLSASIFNENFGLKAISSDLPLHLGGAISIAFTRKSNGIYRKKGQLEVGYFQHAPLFQAAYLAWKPKYEWQFNNGLQLHALWGIGYLHAFPTEATFVQENGEYQSQQHFGKPSGMASLGAGLGYQFARNSAMPLTVFARQEWMLFAPFQLNEALPASINALLQLGISINW